MSESDIQVILHRLDELSSRLDEIHSEVKKTNGRVTELEMNDAWWKGKEEAKRPYGTVLTTIVAYGVLAVLTWFIAKNV